jgi:hypothetical protein
MGISQLSLVALPSAETSGFGEGYYFTVFLAVCLTVPVVFAVEVFSAADCFLVLDALFGFDRTASA